MKNFLESTVFKNLNFLSFVATHAFCHDTFVDKKSGQCFLAMFYGKSFELKEDDSLINPWVVLFKGTKNNCYYKRFSNYFTMWCYIIAKLIADFVDLNKKGLTHFRSDN